MHKLYRFNEDRKLFGSQLKKTMAEKKLSIPSFIKALDEKEFPVTENTVKKWRSGDRIPNIDNLKIIADLLGVSMQYLYMPKSKYDAKFSDQMQLLLEGRISPQEVSAEVLKEIDYYFEYLMQKMLFSFLSFNERRNMDTLFSCFQITNYGTEKLNLSSGCSFSDFCEKIKVYMTNTYGKKLPYEITGEKAEEIYTDFEKVISFMY